LVKRAPEQPRTLTIYKKAIANLSLAEPAAVRRSVLRRR